MVKDTFYIDQKSGVPIYLQIKLYFKSLIANHSLAAGDQLPTIRELSVDLTVNPNTISRAYSELEREGMIATQQGRGTFVIETESCDIFDAISHQQLCDLLNNTIVEARLLGYSLDDIQKCMNDQLQSLQKNQ